MYAELAYLLSGHETTANVTKAYETTIRGRFGIGRGTKIVVDYTFAEPDGTRRTDSCNMSSDWIPTQQVTVRYTPGANGRSRIAGEVNWIWIIIFAASIASIGFFGFRLWREFQEGDKPRKVRRLK